ncbi:MAG: pyridoxal-phosphate dependent enzyme, partial [Gammaproteobacteria bacterium]|nr:pyridoxal-phosphate dependent enzyme [Desulfobacterales bacterium]NIW09382.1 pyridoxal-phosphate dependent enzyme [Gammaproteobacteria bacterium]
HYETTGPEIWQQTEGRITHFFAGLGTCGTVSGVGRFLKEKNQAIRVVAIGPQKNHRIPGLKNFQESREPPI